MEGSSYTFDVLCLQRRLVFLFPLSVDPDLLLTSISFVCSQSVFSFITQISFCRCVKYVCFCYSRPHRACASITSPFLVDSSLNIEDYSFLAHGDSNKGLFCFLNLPELNNVRHMASTNTPLQCLIFLQPAFPLECMCSCDFAYASFI